MNLSSAMIILYILEWILFFLVIWEGIREQFGFWLWIWAPICYWGLAAIFNGIFKSLYPVHGFIKSTFIIFGSLIGILVALAIWGLLSSLPDGLGSGGGSNGNSKSRGKNPEDDSSPFELSSPFHLPPPSFSSDLISLSNKTDNEQIYDLMPGASRIEEDPATNIRTVYNKDGQQIAEIRPETKAHLFEASEPVDAVYSNDERQIFEIHHEVKQEAFIPDTNVDIVYNSSGRKVLEVRHEEERHGFVGEEHVPVNNVYNNDNNVVSSIEAQTRNRLLSPDERYKEINSKVKKS